MRTGPSLALYPLTSYTIGQKEALISKSNLANTTTTTTTTNNNNSNNNNNTNTNNSSNSNINNSNNSNSNNNYNGNIQKSNGGESQESLSGLPTSLGMSQRTRRMRQIYLTEGMRRTVEAVLLTHENRIPHVLLLQDTSILTSNTATVAEDIYYRYRLPGGRLHPGEDEEEGLQKKLHRKLSPGGVKSRWDTGDLLCTWYRPSFNVAYFPYLPAHITRPKETKKVFLIHLPQSFTFQIPKNLSLVAVPLHDLYNTSLYGPIIGALPVALSRCSFMIMNPMVVEIEFIGKSEDEKDKDMKSVVV